MKKTRRKRASRVEKKVLKKVTPTVIRTIVEFLMISIKIAMPHFSKEMDIEKLSRLQSRFRDKRE